MKYNKLLIIIPFLSLCLNVYAQTDKETAHSKGVDAVKLEDEGKFDDAITLLTEAQKLDPENIAYPYEMTYCFYGQQKYQKVIDELTTLKDRPDSFDRLYELLGNSYDDLNQSDKAVAIYDEGLKKFPNSGCLYLERGIIPLDKKDYATAVGYFEKGIELSPGFASNYYWAAKIYCASESPMWGLMYGEIFMNLERNSKRTAEMSKLLFDTYKNNIKFISSDKISTSFDKNTTIKLTDSKEIKIPYGMIYEPTMAFALAGQSEIDLNSLDIIRQNFLSFYIKREFDKKYPNVIFIYQDEITKAGQIEAYNHWLLSQGDADNFTKWQNQNQPKWDAFIKWFATNQIQMDDQHRFYRNMY